MLDANDLECLRGTRRLFAGISFALAPGECLQVHGANGSGKTSLLRILCGLARPERGRCAGTKPIDVAGDEYRATLAFCGHANAPRKTSRGGKPACRCAHGTPATGDSTRTALDAFGIRNLEALPVVRFENRSAASRRAPCRFRARQDSRRAACRARCRRSRNARNATRFLAQGACVLTSHQPINCAPMRRLVVNAPSSGAVFAGSSGAIAAAARRRSEPPSLRFFVIVASLFPLGWDPIPNCCAGSRPGLGRGAACPMLASAACSRPTTRTER
jgi:heme exporter protein A